MFPIFIGLLIATVLLALGVIIRAARRPHEIPQLPLVASAMWLYFYGFMAYVAARDLRTFLPDWTLAVGQGAALASLVGLIAGWSLALRFPQAAPRAARKSPSYDTGVLWWAGALFIVSSSLVHYYLIRQPDIDWQKTSAYLYLFFHVGYPGMALCVVARVKGKYHLPLEKIAFIGVVAFAMFPHLIAARRGPLFPLVMVVVFLPALLRRIKPRRVVLFGALGAAGVLMLLFVAVRPWIYAGGKADSITADSWVEAVSSLSVDQVVVERSRKVSDNEYVYHCGTIATNVELAHYQYGTGYLTLLTHWVPRTWWPGKPVLGEGWYGSTVQLVPVVMGWQLTAGASAGGVSEVFNQFGWISPLFWFLVAWCSGRVYRRAMVDDDPRWAVAYVGILCGTHWLISQGFSAAFVPGAIYQVVPVGVFLIARKQKPWRRLVPAPGRPV